MMNDDGPVHVSSVARRNAITKGGRGMTRIRKRRGFTLTEMILVIIILGLLALIIIPKFGNQAEKAKIARIQANLLALRSAIRLWQADHDGEPPSKLSDLVPDYLPQIPKEALTESAKEVSVHDGTGGWVYDNGQIWVNLPPASLSEELKKETPAMGG